MEPVQAIMTLSYLLVSIALVLLCVETRVPNICVPCAFGFVVVGGGGGGGGELRGAASHLSHAAGPQRFLADDGAGSCQKGVRLQRLAGRPGGGGVLVRVGETAAGSEGPGDGQPSSTDDGSAEQPSSGSNRGLPTYDGTALAREVFANPCFYYDNEIVAEQMRAMREAVFDEGTTIDQVRDAYANRPDDGYLQLARDIGASDVAVKAFFSSPAPTMEEMLNDRGLVTLDDGGELLLLNKRYVSGLPATRDLLSDQSSPDSTRSTALGYTLGSSGSGKTFFAMRELKNFRNDNHLPSVTIYLLPSDLNMDFTRADAPGVLIAKVQEKLQKAVPLSPGWNRRKLNMHVCLVFDEAGSVRLKGFFDQREAVVSIVALARKVLAESVFVVICGTGITGTAFNSRKEVYKFRLRPWNREDLERVMQFRELPLRDGETTSTVADAIFYQPLLAALVTNARSAGFLVDSVVNTTRLSYAPWLAHLSMITPAIVSQVVSDYCRENGLVELESMKGTFSSPRVAAWLFGALADLKEFSTKLPELDGLSEKERVIAQSLLQFNVEDVGGKRRLIGDDRYSASITPAIAIILFALVRIPVDILTGWQAVEEAAALFAVRQLVIIKAWKMYKEKELIPLQESYSPFRCEMTLEEFEDSLVDENRFEAYEIERTSKEVDLGRSLGKTMLLRLQKRVQGPTKKNGSVIVPIASNSTVLLNGAMASFADVIAPYTLIQTKATLKASLYVDFTEELRKCCLLRRCDDDRVLRGLLALWRGVFNNVAAPSAAPKSNKKKKKPPGVKIQRSRAYPENLIEVRTPLDLVSEYAEIEFDGTLRGRRTRVVLPELPGSVPVDFILFTNAVRVRLDLSKALRIVVDESLLDEDLRLDPTKISNETARSGLEAFLKETVRPGVVLRFVFTKPSDEERP